MTLIQFLHIHIALVMVKSDSSFPGMTEKETASKQSKR